MKCRVCSALQTYCGEEKINPVADFLVAKRCNGVNHAGTKRPMYMDCLDPAGDETPWLVKVGRVGRINEKHLAAEIVSATLASGLGLYVADHRVVILDKPHLQGINMTLSELDEGASLSPGFGVGARQQNGAQSMATHVDFGKSFRADASVLYAFDLMATHYDRLSENPNCGVLNGRLFVYDFDQCFPDVSEPSSLFGSRKPWEVAQVDWRDLHVCRESLKKHGLDKEALETAYSTWTGRWWEENKPTIPEDWNEVANAIWDQASQILPKLPTFIDEVEKSLI